MGSIVQIAFFLTPVMWNPELLGDHAYIAAFNPFYHMLEIMRSPLLGQPFPLDSFAAVIAMTVINFAIAALFFRRFRSRIAYWV